MPPDSQSRTFLYSGWPKERKRPDLVGVLHKKFLIIFLSHFFIDAVYTERKMDWKSSPRVIGVILSQIGEVKTPMIVIFTPIEGEFLLEDIGIKSSQSR